MCTPYFWTAAALITYSVLETRATAPEPRRARMLSEVPLPGPGCTAVGEVLDVATVRIPGNQPPVAAEGMGLLLHMLLPPSRTVLT